MPLTLSDKDDELECLIAPPPSPPTNSFSFDVDTSSDHHDNHANKPNTHIPLHAYLVLPFSILAISSAGTAFLLMSPIPPLTLAAWRLQGTSLILMFFAAIQWRSMSIEERKKSTSLETLGAIALSGLCLALHFGLWLGSLSLTTLTHSLLFVTSTPLWVAAWSLITRRPISRLEVIGLALGACGSIVVSLATGLGSTSNGASSGSSITPSFIGDLLALGAAISIVGYLEVGKSLRAWMPLWVYIFPVTAFAALLISLASLTVDSGSQVSHAHIFGYTESLFLFGVVCYLAIGPGLVGHCGFNFLLRYMSTLSVSLSFQLEPIIGSLIGWIFAVQSAPSILTILGGLVMVGGTVTVVWGSDKAQAGNNNSTLPQSSAAGMKDQVESAIGARESDDL